jgi:hypothetical protein
MQVDLCVGAGGSEVGIYRFPITLFNPRAGAPFIFTLPNPLGNIPAGSRVSVRVRSATGSSTCDVKLAYFHKPL